MSVLARIAALPSSRSRRPPPTRHRLRSLRWQLWPSAGTRRRWWRTFRRAPYGMQLFFSATILLTIVLALNGAYQIIRKPSELFFPVSSALNKTPVQTWRDYAPIFREHATDVMTPSLLAALAQVEASGNPVARTYWRWSWTTAQPFDVYRPASSAVGMYQITDGTFAQARHLCIHDHAVAQDGRWNDWHSCWFNSMYTRVVPSHAVELTSAYLDHSVATILARHGLHATALARKQELAALIHLCGAEAGEQFARRRFHLTAGQRCGDQPVGNYLARVQAMQGVFGRLADEPGASAQ
ncbi:MAG: lytic transglycosylase domain-containing protein [Steroidobacteraceae bacterium]